MAPFRWILLLAGLTLLALIFAYGRGWFKQLGELRRNLTARKRARDQSGHAETADVVVIAAEPEPDAETRAERASMPVLEPDSKVITVRILPGAGGSFPAEQMVLALRAAGLRHGLHGIFHCHDLQDPERIRFSVASLVEPGSFDLAKLKESYYSGVSIFAVFPAPEDGMRLFDDMVAKAREIARAVEGRLADEQGGALSLQRERYMREDLIEYLRRREVSNGAGEREAG